MFGPSPGPHLDDAGRCHWHVWAPRAQQGHLVLYDAQGKETAVHPLRRQSNGDFEIEMENVEVGQRYAFSLNQQPPRPDPASRWQPDGVHSPSAVWRATDWQWTDTAWMGIALADHVIYELHVGTFSPEGTFNGIIPRLAALRDLGITAIELMPVAQFPGGRGWGYDGTYWYAVQHSYGGPTELQRLVDACHAVGLAIILDVVYNHLGPEGNYLGVYGPYFTDRHHTPWGSAIHYDGPSCEPIREFVLENARQWIRDFHFDGLRLDAISEIRDDSTPHLLTEIKRVAEEEARRSGRRVHVIAESNLNDVKVLDPPDKGGYGLDAQWNDDFHHCVHTLLTGELKGYYADYQTPARQLVKALVDVFVFDGAYSHYRQRKHGAPVGQHGGEKFIVSIQTHDQVGNRACGDRLGTLGDLSQQRLAAGLLLLAPHVPMLFMGEEYGETRPFPFFCDFGDKKLGEAVRRGRRREFASFGWSGEFPDPLTRATFDSAVLSWSWPEGSPQAGLRCLYQTLLALRRTHPAMRDFVHRTVKLFPSDDQPEVLLLTRGDSASPHVHLAVMFNLTSQPVPCPVWEGSPRPVLLSSEEPRFGGAGNESQPLQPYAFLVFGNSR